VVDVTLINGTSIAVTLGARRNTRSSSAADPQEVIFVNSRVVLPIEAAQVLAHLLSRMLHRAEELKAEMKAGEPRAVPAEPSEAPPRPRGKVS
jgi:hypothetical protein